MTRWGSQVRVLYRPFGSLYPFAICPLLGHFEMGWKAFSLLSLASLVLSVASLGMWAFARHHRYGCYHVTFRWQENGSSLGLSLHEQSWDDGGIFFMRREYSFDSRSNGPNGVFSS